MPQLRPQGNSPTRHALLRDEMSKMRYTNDKVITDDFSRGNQIEDYFPEMMRTEAQAFDAEFEECCGHIRA
jgi:hypothetical protein